MTRRLLRLFILSPLLIMALGSTDVVAHPSTEPVARTDEHWVKRQELLNQRVAEAGKTAKVIFIGDSITEAWEQDGKKIWAQHFATHGAINLGVSGDQTQHVLWRLDHGNLVGLNPKTAVLMIGTNNVSAAAFDGSTVGQIAEGVAAVVQKLKDKLPQIRILLVGIFPRGLSPNAQRGDALQVNQIIQKLADGRNVFYLDFGARFISRDGTIPAEVMPDYLHLSAKGYRIRAEAIEDQLSLLLGESR